jgi:YD repeat-containing protein
LFADGPTSIALLGSTSDNAAGLLLGRTLGGGISETRSYNPRDQLTLIHAAVGADTLLNLGFVYGAINNGRIASRTDGVQPEHSVDYTYDAIGRLKQATNPVSM